MAVELLCPVPGCASPTSVDRTTKHVDRVDRMRRCANGHLTPTYERAAGPGFDIVRRDGTIEPFDRAVLLRSIELAGGDRLPKSDAAEVADEIIAGLIKSGQPRTTPIPTLRLGQYVLRTLKKRSRFATLRYSIIFRASRHEPEVHVSSAQEWLTQCEEEYRIKATPHDQPFPAKVQKKPTRNSPTGELQTFDILRLWNSLKIATRGLIDTANWAPDPAYVASTEFDRSDLFVGTLVAAVIAEVKYQRIVTSAQLSAACMSILREIVPLGYMRYAPYTKQFTMPEEILNECWGLINHPSFDPAIVGTPAWEGRWRTHIEEAIKIYIPEKQHWES